MKIEYFEITYNQTKKMESFKFRYYKSALTTYLNILNDTKKPVNSLKFWIYPQFASKIDYTNTLNKYLDKKTITAIIPYHNSGQV